MPPRRNVHTSNVVAAAATSSTSSVPPARKARTRLTNVSVPSSVGVKVG
jgi:hypothetical protein